MKQIEILETQISSEIPMSYHHINAGADKPLLIFFHGYSDSAQSLLRRSYPQLDERYEILAINGLFPVPQKKDNVWKQAFAWYFADFTTDSVLIHPKVSAKAVTHLIEKLDLVNRPKVLIGFSQGGFFLPFILPHLKNVKHLIGIGAAYRKHNYKTNLNVQLDAIHGTEDDVITYLQAEESFQDLKTSINPKGQFKGFAGLGHTMNDESRAWLQNRIHEIFNES